MKKTGRSIATVAVTTQEPKKLALMAHLPTTRWKAALPARILLGGAEGLSNQEVTAWTASEDSPFRKLENSNSQTQVCRRFAASILTRFATANILRAGWLGPKTNCS